MKHKQSQLRSLSIFVLVILCVGVVFGANASFNPDYLWIHSLPDLIEINETTLYIYDLNVTNESNVIFEISDSGGSIQPYLGVNNGVFEIGLPQYFLGQTIGQIFPSVSTFTIFVKEGDNPVAYNTFKINVTNVNEPPRFLETNYTANADGETYTRRSDLDDDPIVSPIRIELSENQSYYFNVSYEDLDPSANDWNNITAEWRFADSDKFSDYNVSDRVSSCSSTTNQSFISCFYSFGLDSSGVHILSLNISDGGSPSLSSILEWNLTIKNINRSPYFTFNQTSGGLPDGFYDGFPLIQVDEFENITFSVNYTDDDKNNPDSGLEFFDLTSFFYINYVDSVYNSTNDTFSEYIFITNSSTVGGGRDSLIYNISAVVFDDGGLNDTIEWRVNVSNVDVPPEITSITHESSDVSVQGSSRNIFEGLTSDITFDFEDVDFNLDYASISINGSVVSYNNSLTDSGSLSLSEHWNFSESGQYNISFFVNDTLSGNNTFWFIINVINNTEPYNVSLSITNRTGGVTFYENDSLQIVVTFSDNQTNANTVTSYLDVNGSTYVGGSWDTTNFNINPGSFSKVYPLDFQSRGWYNISTQIFDDEGLFTDVIFNDTIYVNPVDVSPTISGISYTNQTNGVKYEYSITPFTSPTITMNEGESFSVEIDFSDLNGDTTIESMQLYSNNSLLKEELIPSTLRFNNWSRNFSSAGTYNISFFANDTTGLNVSSWFLLNVTNNTAPNITSFNLYNSSNELTNIFVENSTLFLNFTYEDSFNNIDSVSVTVDDIPANVTFDQNNFFVNASYYFGFETAGNNKVVSIFINDTEGWNSTDSQLVNVSFAARPPVIEWVLVEDLNGVSNYTSGDQVTVQEVNSNIGNNTVTISFNATDLNNDLNLSNATITFNGTPYVGSLSQSFDLNLTSQGDYIINISITDNTSRIDDLSFTLRVVDNIAPVIDEVTVIDTVSDDEVLFENNSVSFEINASDVNSNIDYFDLLFSGVFDSVFGITWGGINLVGGIYTYTPVDVPLFNESGLYNYTVILYDTEGFNDTINGTFFINQTNLPPVLDAFGINGQNVLSNSAPIIVYEGNEVTFSLTTSNDNRDDLLDIDYAQIVIDGVVENASCSSSLPNTGGTINCAWTPGLTDQGTRLIEARSFDIGGLNKTFAFNITIQDNVDPVIENFTIRNSSGDISSTFTEGDFMNVTFDYYDTNNNVDDYYISINFSGGTQFFYSTNLSYTFNFSSAGTYNVTAYVNDSFNAVDTTSSIITVDAFEFTPVIENITVVEFDDTTYYPTSPGDTIYITQNYFKNQNTLNITINASDANGQDDLGIYNVTTNSTTYQDTNNSYLWQITYNDIGLYRVNISVTDLSPDSLSTSTFFYVNITNNSVPVIDVNLSLDGDGNETIVENKTLYLNLSVSDIDNNIDTYYISFDGEIVASGTTAIGGDLNWSRYFNFTSAGSYDIIYFVNDTAGRNHTITETIIVEPTEIAPTIEDVQIEINDDPIIYSLGSNVTFFETDKIRVEFTADDVNEDLVTYEVYLNGSLNKTSSLTENTPVPWTWQTTYLDQGMKNITFVAIDSDGLENTTYTFFLNITDNLAPNITYFNITNTNGEVVNNSNNAREGQTITINATTFDDLNDFNNSENITIKIDGVVVAQNLSGEARVLNISYDWYLDYDLTNTTREYNVSIISYDNQGLNGTASKIVTVYHTPRNPIIEYQQVQILSNTAYDIGNGTVNTTTDDTGWQTVSNGATVIINETNTINYRIIARDENGNSTLRNVTFTLFDTVSSSLRDSEIDIYGVNEYIFTPSYDNSSIYFVNATVNDIDLNESMTYFILNVTNNSAPTIVDIEITNQDDVNCDTGDCEEGDTVTVNVTISDDFSPVANITIFQRNQSGHTISTYTCISTYFCANDYFLDYTSRGLWDFYVEVNDDEPLLTTGNNSITVRAVEIAPEIDRIVINSTLQNRSWNLTSANFSCDPSLANSDRSCLYTGDEIALSEGDSVTVATSLFDTNGNSTLLYSTDASTLYDGNVPKSASSESLFLDWSLIEFNRFENEVVGYNIRQIISDTSGLDFDLRIDVTIENNVYPQLANISLTNSTGDETLTFYENDSITVLFNATDVNNNLDSYRIKINSTTYGDVVDVNTNNYTFNFNLSSYGDYMVYVYANDTQPLVNFSNFTITVLPVNISPVITGVTISNGTGVVEMQEGLTYTTYENVNYEINVSAYDLNGNASIVYDIYRNGTNTPLTLGSSNETSWPINFSQEGLYNITINLTTDRLGEEINTYFLLDVINNTPPMLTYLNFTSNLTNLSEQNFVEGQWIYMNYSFFDNQSNIDTQYIRLTRSTSPVRINVTNETYFAYRFPFENGGAEIEYNLTFFANDTEGLTFSNQTFFTFNVSPEPTAPVISNVQIAFSNNTNITPINDTTYTFYENQNATISFTVTDVNADENVTQIWNGTDWVLGNTTSINTTYTTVISGASLDYEISLFANDSTSRTTYYNFTLRLLNNTAPDVTIADVSLDGFSFAGGYLENNTFSMTIDDYYDLEKDIDFINLSILTDDGQNTLVNSTIITPATVPSTLDHFFDIGERGNYIAYFYVQDLEGLNNSYDSPFKITVDNTAPYIENITVNSTYFPDSILAPLDSFTTQEGDTIIISFDAYDIDNVSEAIGQLDQLRIIKNTTPANTFDFIPASSNGNISYTWVLSFTDSGYYPVRLVASDRAGSETSRTIYINVTDNLAPIITLFNASNETGVPKLNFAEGENITFNWSVSEPNLYANFDSYIVYKEGVEVDSGFLSSNGYFDSSFNFSSEGSYNYTLYVEDTQGLNDTAELNITVGSTDFDPVISNPVFNNGSGEVSLTIGSQVTAYEDDTLTFGFTASDANTNDILVYDISSNISLENLPVASNYSSFNLTNWDDEGTYNITYFVDDSTGRNDSTWFILTILNNTAPFINYTNITNSTGGDTYYENDTITFTFDYYDNQSNNASYYIQINGTIYDTTKTQTFTVPFLGNGTYDYTFFVNDTQGLNDTNSSSITVLVNNQDPVIQDVLVTISNNTPVSLAEFDVVSIYENQNATISFSVYDINENENVSLIYNGSSWITGNSTLFVSDYMTVLTDGLRDFNISLFANDSFSAEAEFNFTLRVLNNTAPSIDGSDISITGTLNPNSPNDDLQVMYLDNQTLNFSVLSYYDLESDGSSITANLYKNGPGGFSLVESSVISPITTPSIYSNYFNISDRGVYYVNFTITDNEGLSTNNQTDIFEVRGLNQVPYIENITVNSTLFANEDVSALGTYITQEGDTIIISFDAYDIDEGDSVVDTGVRVENGTPYTVVKTLGSIPASWALTFSESGFYRLRLRADDNIGSAITYIFINVTNNVAPVIDLFNASNETGIPKLTFAEGELINFTFDITEPNLHPNYDSYVLYRNATSGSVVVDSGSLSSSNSFSTTFNYSSEGHYNYTLFVNDTQGLNDTAELTIIVSATEFAPIISNPVFNNGSGDVSLTLGQTVTAYEDDVLTFSFNASDINTNDILYYNISSNVTLQDLPVANNFTTITLADWDDEGIYNITYFVNDSTGRNDSIWFTLNIIDNTAPVINYTNISNSTGGTTYYENDTITLSFTFNDTTNNAGAGNGGSHFITFDGVTYPSVLSTDVVVPILSAGVYNYTFYVDDAEGVTSNDTISGNITVLPLDRNPVIEYAFFTNANGTTSLTGGETVYMQENTAGAIGFNASDININIANYSITSIPSLEGVNSNINYTSFTLTSWNDQGTYNITLFVNDTTGLNDTLNFTLIVIDNTVPYVISNSTLNSTGGVMLFENDSIDIEFIYRDNQSNYDSAVLYYDGSAISTLITDSGINKKATAFVPLSWTSSGWHNITFVANDTNNLVLNVTQQVFVNNTFAIPEITEMSIFYDNTLTKVTNGQVFNVFEGKQLYFSFEAEDLNTDENLTQYIAVNVTPEVNSTDYDLLWTIGFEDAGLRNLSATITDEFGYSSSQYVVLNISENVAPEVNNFSVVNANGSLTIAEGATVNITYNVTDQQDNLDLVVIGYNGSTIGTYSNSLRTIQHFIPYTDRGNQTFTLNASDEQGLWTPDEVNVTVLSTEIDPVILYANINRTSENGTQITDFSSTPPILATTGDTVNISFVGADVNGNNTIDSYWIERNDTLVASTNFYSFQFLGSVEQNFTLFVNDSFGLVTNASFRIRNGTNTAPIVENLTIVDSVTGLTNLFENRTINITYDVFDVDDNIQSQKVYLNGSQIGTANGTQQFFDFNTEGVYNITVNVTDYEGEVASISQPITILKTNVSPSIDTIIVNAYGANYQPSSSQVIQSFEGDAITISFNASDVNNDISSYVVYRNGSSIGGNSTLWNVNYSAVGFYNLTLFVNDTSGLNDTFQFFINVSDNLPAYNLSLNITNSTGGTTFVGGNPIFIFANATDPEGQPLTYAITYDGSPQGDGQSKSFGLSDTTHGERNVSFTVNDGEITSSNWTLITIIKKQLPPELENLTVESQTISLTTLPPVNSTISIEEGESVNVSAISSDFNDDLAAVSYQLFKWSGTQWNDQGTTIAPSVLFEPTYGDIGLYKYDIIVNDSLGQTDAGNITITVTDNLDPNITSVSILNNSQGTYYSEGDLLSIEINFTEVFDSEGSINLSINSEDVPFTRFGSTVVASYNLNYTSRGTIPFNFTVFDDEGLFDTYLDNLIINPTDLASVIEEDSIIVNANNTNYNPTSGQTITSFEGDTVSISFGATDLNEDIDTYIVFRNGTNIGGDDTTWNVNYSAAGLYNMTLFVNDTSGLNDTFQFWINVIDNEDPEITSVTILNSTGGTTYYENDTLNVTINFTGILLTEGSFDMALNGSSIPFTRNGNSLNTTLFFNLSSRGEYELVTNVEDNEGLDATNTTSITINPTPIAPVIYNVTYRNVDYFYLTPLTDGDTLITGEGFGNSTNFIEFYYTVSDANGLSNIDYTEIITNFPGGDNFTFDYSSSGVYDVAIIAYDIDGLSSEPFNITLDVWDNTAPSVSVSLANSTGGDAYIQGDVLNLTLNITGENNFVNVTISYNDVSQFYTLNSDEFSRYGIINFTDLLNLTSYANETINISVVAYDHQGLNGTFNDSIYVNATNIPPVINYVNILTGVFTKNMSLNEMVSLPEGQGGSIFIDANDPNGDSLTYNISINGTNYTTANISGVSFGGKGLVDVLINVSDGVFSTLSNFTINLSENVPPVINSFEIFNSTGGTDYYEKDTLSIFINATDVNNDLDSYELNLSKNLTGNFINSSYQFEFENYSYVKTFTNYNISYTLPGFTAGIVNISLIVLDTMSLNDTLLTNITVINKEFVPEILQPVVEDEEVLNDTLIAKFNPGNAIRFSFNASDADLDGDFVYINITRSNNASITYQYNVSNYSYTLPSNDPVGTVYNITYFVNDSLGHFDALHFRLKTVKANEVQVQVPNPGRGGGSGGGGGGSSPAPRTSTDVEIKNPAPVEIASGEELFRTITIRNPGSRALLITDLIPNYDSSLYEVEIMGEYINLTLDANESRDLQVRLKNIGSRVGGDITFTVKGTSGGQETTDEAIMYINSLASDFAESDTEYLELLRYVRNVINDNPECLELIDTVSRGEASYNSGDSSQAMSYLRDARDKCLQKTRSSIDTVNTEIYQDSGEIRNLIIQGLIIVLILLILPSLYLYFKRKGDKDVDVKEQEIEDWLDDFYKK